MSSGGDIIRSVVPIAASFGALVFLGPAGLGLSAGWVAAGAAVAGLTASFAASTLFPVDTPDLSFDYSFGDFSTSDRLRNIRQPIAYRRLVYGRVRIGGTITFFANTKEETASGTEEIDGSNYFHELVTLSGRPLDGFEDLYANDQLASIDPDTHQVLDENGVPMFSGKLKVWLGDGTVAGDAELQAALHASCPAKWTDAHRQYGCAKMYLRHEWASGVWSDGLPTVTVVARGHQVYDPRTGLTAWTANAALVIRDWLTHKFGVGDAAARCPDDWYVSEANASDEQVAVADSSTDPYAAHRLVIDTRAYGAACQVGEVQFCENGEPLATAGLTKLGDMTQGAGLAAAFDGELAATSAECARSLSGLGYIGVDWGGTRTINRVIISGAGNGGYDGSGNGRVVVTLQGREPDGVTWTDLKTWRFTDASDYCQHTLVVSSLGTTEARYEINGTIDLDQIRKKVLESLLTSCCGRLTDTGGRLLLYTAIWREPPTDPTTDLPLELTLDDLAGSIQITAFNARRDLFNVVNGTFCDPDQLWQTSDFPAVRVAAYVEEDQGEELDKSIALPFEISASRAQRIARIVLERARRAMTAVLPCKLTAYQCMIAEPVLLTLDRYGLAQKYFEVMKWTFSQAEGDDGPVPGVNLTLTETDSGVFSWTSAQEQAVNKAPRTNLASSADVAPPTNLAAVLERYETRPGAGTKLKIVLAWNASAYGYANAYEVQYRVSGAGDWQAAGLVSDLRLEILDIKPAVYEIRVRARNVRGGMSAWAPLTEDLEWLADGPPAPASLYRQGNLAYWTYPYSPVDFDNTFQARVLAGKTLNWAKGADWPSEGAVVKDRKLDISDMGAGVMTLMVKARDIFGNLSADTAFLTLGLGEYAPANLIATSDERAAGFPGTVTSGSVDGEGNLAADDDGELYLPDDDALYLPVVDDPYLEVSYQAMTYEWTYRPDATDVPGVAYLESEIAGDGWSISYRRRGSQEEYLGNDDELYLPDPDALYLGGPTAWAPFPGGIDVAREAVDFRVATDSGSRQGKVSTLAVNIDVVDVEESFEDLVISAAGTRLPITQSYRAIDYIGAITLQYDGYGATGVVVLAKAPDLGPLLAAIGASQATIDIQNMKGH